MTTSEPNRITHPIIIIGLSARGQADLSPRQLEMVSGAGTLVGGKRHLGYFPEFGGETIAVVGPLEPILSQIETAYRAGERVVVLASGDPLFHGLGTKLGRRFGTDALQFEPAPTASQLAFAALGEPWDDAALLSVHAHPLESVLPQILAAPKAAILTDRHNTPTVIARRLLEIGVVPETACAVCENLGGSDEQVIRTTLGRAAEATFAPLNVFVVWMADGLTPTGFPGLAG
jgi:precorrin-6Y C5,15-methyltransferase (decarboxylating)